MGLNKSRTINLIQKSEFRISFSNKNNNQKINEYRRVRQSKQTIGREVNYLENLKTTNYLLRTKKTCRSLTGFRGESCPRFCLFKKCKIEESHS